jgi:hypothetical protein
MTASLNFDIRILPLQKNYTIYLINCWYHKIYRLESLRSVLNDLKEEK